MRVLVINNSATVKNGQGEFFVHRSTGEFGLRLVELGHKVEFYQLVRHTKSTNNYFPLLLNGISVSSVELGLSKLRNYFIGYLQGIRRVFKNDYIYMFYPNSFSLLLLVAVIFGKRYGIYIRGEKGVESAFSKFLYRHADSIFTVSNLFTDYINRLNMRVKAATIKPMIPFSEKDIIYNKEYSCKTHYRLLFLSRIDKDKGIFELLDAVRILKNRGFNFVLEVVGDGSILNSVIERTVEDSTQDYVQFYGALSDIESIKERYIHADLFILPTYHEGFPRTLYEAMIFGVPIITTFVGTIPGLMKDGFNCFKIQPRSVQSLVDKLSMVMSDYSVVEDVVRNALETVYPLVLTEKPTHPEMLHEAITRNQ